MAEDKSQQTEDATPKRLEEARNKGQVASSKEPSAALSFLLLASLGVTGIGAWLSEHLMYIMRHYLTLGPAILESGKMGVQMLLHSILVDMVETILPLVLPMLILGVLITLLVSGPVFSLEAVKPKFNKLNPLSGLKNLGSTKSLAELVKSVLKISIVSAAAWVVVESMLPQIIQAGNGNAYGIATLAWYGSAKLLALAAMIFVPVAIADIFYQRWEHAKSMRMSKKEIKDENKDSEGDPQVKAKIRQIQQQQAKNRMMADVPKADVVITNPTRLAIALAYKPDQVGAPKVLAKGKGEIAKRIREIAAENHIPLHENKPLARSLFTIAEVGDEIPEHLYEAVAIILAEIFRLK